MRSLAEHAVQCPGSVHGLPNIVGYCDMTFKLCIVCHDRSCRDQHLQTVPSM